MPQPCPDHTSVDYQVAYWCNMITITASTGAIRGFFYFHQKMYNIMHDQKELVIDVTYQPNASYRPKTEEKTYVISLFGILFNLHYFRGWNVFNESAIDETKVRWKINKIVWDGNYFARLLNVRFVMLSSLLNNNESLDQLKHCLRKIICYSHSLLQALDCFHFMIIFRVRTANFLASAQKLRLVAIS